MDNQIEDRKKESTAQKLLTFSVNMDNMDKIVEDIGKEISLEDYAKLTKEELKACSGCSNRIKDIGHISRQCGEKHSIVYGCSLTQTGLHKELIYLPEHCKAKNVDATVHVKNTISGNQGKVRDNCQVCNVMKEGKTICKMEGIKNVVCPCKTCDSFMRNEYGCMNFTKECQAGFKYDRIEVPNEILDTKV